MLLPMAHAQTAHTQFQAQFQAADPAQSVWLAAHAGTGKTKVLTDRVLRILLSGVPLEAIVCLTYTKAAAMEMQHRLRKELARWCTQDKAALAQSLEVLLGRGATTAELTLAPTLLCQLLDHPKGIAIQTIHAFCQSLISAFPIEAGLPYGVEVADEARAAELLHASVQQLYRLEMGTADQHIIADALEAVATAAGDETLRGILHAVVAEHALFFALLGREGGKQKLMDDIAAALHVDAQMSAASVDTALAAWMAEHADALRLAGLAWQSGSDKTAAIASALLRVLASPSDAALLQAFLSACRTGKGELRAASVFTIKKEPDHNLILARLYDALEQHQDQLRALACARFSCHIVTLADGLLTRYAEQKARAGLLDYDDVIIACIRLLSDEESRGWVASRLGYRVRHLLLDEAQDTSPAQWVLLGQLIGELFQGDHASEARSLFVVGDKKQSIYRFQGADPQLFSQSEQEYERWFSQAGLPFVRLSLDTSFRSSSAVLEAVDALCALPQLRGAIGQMASGHRPHRSHDAGRVELWPLIGVPKPEISSAWELAAPAYALPDANEQLAAHVAKTIADWLAQGRVLPSKGRAIRPEDIMVLVRRRGALVRALHRQLHRLHVPVAGADRIDLASHLAVQDMLAMARWCLLASDDLSLACVLKGPLFALDERALFDVAYGRAEASLWQRLRGLPQHKATVATLQALAEAAQHRTPYEFFVLMLYEYGLFSALLARMGNEVRDVCAAFLDQVQQLQSEGQMQLQAVLSRLESMRQQIKRDMEQGVPAVRIMTVHGAKGLQAPVVLLPDTTQKPPLREHVWWGEHEGRHVCFVVPPHHKAPAVVERIKQSVRTADAEEYQRLLYVAATRAEDELYVMGSTSTAKATVPDGSWYALMRCTFAAHYQQVQGESPPAEDAPWTISSPQLHPLPPAQDVAQMPVPPLPDWARMAVPLRESAAAPVYRQASSAHEDKGSLAARRGILVHRLLQWAKADCLADSQAWQALAMRWAEGLPQESAISAAEEARRVRNTAALAWVFGPHSRAEVALQVNLEAGAVLRGQIDRLVLLPDGQHPTEVHIVDFKTGQDNQAVPDAYARQMAAYHAAMQRLYPHAQVQCHLLWTASCRLHTLDMQEAPVALALDSGTACA